MTTVPRPAVALELASARAGKVRQFVEAARQVIAAQRVAQRAGAAILALKHKLTAERKSLNAMIARQQTLLAQLTPGQQAGTGPGTLGAPVSQVGGHDPLPTNTQAGKAVAFAYAQLGKPYVWGATSPDSFDCSGLMMAAWASAGRLRGMRSCWPH